MQDPAPAKSDNGYRAAPDLLAVGYAEAVRSGERMTAWARLAMTLTMSILTVYVLFVVLPGARADAPEVATQRIQIALTGNLIGVALSLIALKVTTRRLFRPWIAWIVVAVDTVFFGVSLWVLMAPNDLTGAYIAGDPAIWALPIMMAVNGLRYDTRVVLTGHAGFTVAVVLVALSYGTGLAPGGLGEASNGMFDGPANAIRLVQVLLTGLVITAAVRRNHLLIGQLVRETEKRADLVRFLPHQVAGQVVAGDPELTRGTRRLVSVMFVDLRAFTTFAEKTDPVEVAAFLSEFRTRISDCVKAHGGMVNSFAGDEVMVLFGAVERAEDDARRAIACADAVVDAIALWDRMARRTGPRPLRVGVGLHTGEVLCGTVGDEERKEFAAVGDAVNVAARLQGKTKELGVAIVASHAAVEAAGGSPGTWRAHGPVTIRGRDSEVEVWARPFVAEAANRAIGA